MQRQIVVTISPEGEVEVKVQGHAGPGCKDLTRQLEAALGTATADRKTPAYQPWKTKGFTATLRDVRLNGHVLLLNAVYRVTFMPRVGTGKIRVREFRA